MFFQYQISTFLTDADLARMNINPYNENELASKFITRLVETSVPTAGDYERVQELLPVAAPSNPLDPFSPIVYSRQYQVVDMFPADIQEFDPQTGNTVTVTVQQQKDRYLLGQKANGKSQVTQTRENIEARPVETVTGPTLDLTPSGLSRLQSNKEYSDANPADTVNITQGSNVQPTNRTDFLAAYAEANTFLENSARAQATVNGLIDNAAAPSNVATVVSVASAAFPPTDMSQPMPSTYVDVVLSYDSDPEQLLYLGNPLPKTGPSGPSGQVVEFDLHSLVSSPSVALDVLEVNGNSTGTLNLAASLDVYFRLGKPYIQFDDSVSPGIYAVTIRLAKLG